MTLFVVNSKDKLNLLLSNLKSIYGKYFKIKSFLPI